MTVEQHVRRPWWRLALDVSILATAVSQGFRQAVHAPASPASITTRPLPPELSPAAPLPPLPMPPAPAPLLPARSPWLESAPSLLGLHAESAVTPRTTNAEKRMPGVY